MEQREFNSTEASDQMQLPPGFRFHPTDEELITHYLLEKFNDAGFNSLAIGEADLNKCEPWDLPRKSKLGEKDCYFFCVRDRKYPTGLRTNRATDAGYWKATGKDREIFRGKQLVGMKKTLVFYRGRAPRGEKTNWIMHEYRLEGKYAINILVTAAKNEWVLCRVFKKSSVLNGKKPFGMIKMGSLSYGEEREGAPPPPSPPPPPLTLSPLMNIEAHVPCFSNTMEGQKAHNPDVSSMFFFSKFKPLHTSLYGGSFMSLLEGDGFEVKQLCKEREMLSISQETGLTTDMNTEISSNSEIMRNSFDQFLWNC